MQENRPTLILLCGIPASGKSSFRRQRRFSGARVVCPDEIRKVVYRRSFDPRHEEIVWEIAYRLLDYWLEKGESAIFDATNLTRARRRPIVSAARRHGAGVVAYVFMPTLEKALERNRSRRDRVPEERIVKMWESFEMPRTEEGIDRIVMKD